MIADPRSDLTGPVLNLSSALVSNDGIPYFEFALPRQPNSSRHEPPADPVLYADLLQANAQEIVSLVTSAWAKHFVIKRILDKIDPPKDACRTRRNCRSGQQVTAAQQTRHNETKDSAKSRRQNLKSGSKMI